MKYSEDYQNDKPMFVIDEKPEVIAGQPEGETPIITIETDNSDTAPTLAPHRKWPWIVGTAVAAVLLSIFGILGYKYYSTHIALGLPVSVTDEQNIAKLEAVPHDTIAGVTMTSDSILGVALNFYELQGLKAEVSFTEPDSTDQSVYMYSRCSDHTSFDAEGKMHYLGSLVAEGKEIEDDLSRRGYCAMANGNIVIGISRSEKVKDYVIEQQGSFFRQFILVSNGVLPSRFYLHGKVERRGLGRIGNKLYLIETRHKETMWDFADALREYGFIDAIYITGGANYSFYRTADGTVHTMGNDTTFDTQFKGKDIIPWLVFKKR